MQDELRRSWGQAIRARREAAGLSQKQLGDRVGVVQHAVSEWEAGKYAPQDHLRVRLADALGVTVAEIFTYPTTDTGAVA